MLINVVLGFVIPWIVGLYLLKDDKKILVIVYPVGVSVALIINQIGVYFGLWKLTPYTGISAISALPLELGFYPILSSLLCLLLSKKKDTGNLLVIFFALCTTLMEAVALMFGKVIYGNSWNLGYTFLSYLLAYFVVQKYFLQCYKLYGIGQREKIR